MICTYIIVIFTFKSCTRCCLKTRTKFKFEEYILFGYSIKIRINFHYVHEENFSLQNFNISTPILNK